jgi:hypothetical protein
MDPIRGVLSEELENSRRLLKRHAEELARLPKGSLVAKKIKGGVFHYLAIREKGKVRFHYKGKLSPADVSKYQEAKQLRRKYVGQVSKLKKQVKFLERALHERKARRPRPG